MRINRAVPMVSLVAIAMFGCNESSLFESTTSSKVSDAGDNDSDAPVGAPDAIGALTCPAPCVGDAVAEFGTAAWSYLGEGPQASGAEYIAMSADGTNSWTAGADGAMITRCDSDTGPCAGVEDYLLMIPGTSGAVPAAPALAFKAPESATYRVSGVVRVPDGSTMDLADRFLLSRNGKHDAVVLTTLRTSTTDAAVDGTFTALAGDEIILSIAGSAATPLAFRLFYSRVDTGAAAFPGDCQLATTFSAGDSFADGCGNAVAQDLTDNGSGPSTTSPGPSDRFGEARVLIEGQYLRLGSSPMDYDGDFTVQFYYKATLPLHFSGPVLFADWNNAVLGGVNLFLEPTATANVGACYQAHGSISEPGLCVPGDGVMDDEWHFLRLVRSVANNSFTLCQDGAEIVSLTVPGDALLSSDTPPHIGRNIDYNPAYYAGSIDDIRVFSSALPCSTTP